MCGGALGYRSDITHSQQSDRHRAAASGPTTLIHLAGVSSPPARLSKRAPSLTRVPIFLWTGSVKSIDRKEISAQRVAVDRHAWRLFRRRLSGLVGGRRTLISPWLASGR